MLTRLINRWNMKRRLIVCISIWAVFCVVITGFLWWSAIESYRGCRPATGVSATDILHGHAPFSTNVVLTGCEDFELDPAIVQGEKKAFAYLPIAVAQTPDGPRLLVARWNADSSEFDRDTLLNDGKVSGMLLWRCKVWKDAAAQIEEHFPGIGIENQIVVGIDAQPRPGVVVALLLLPFFNLLLPVILFKSLHCLLKEEKRYETLLNELSSGVYRENPNALAACGVNEYGRGTYCRPVDRNWSPDEPKEENQPSRTKMWMIKAGTISTGIVLYVMINMGLSEFHRLLDQSLIVVGGLAALGFGLVGAWLKLSGSQQKLHRDTSREKPVDPQNCNFKDSNFYRYHHRVLTDLGMTECGDFRCSQIQGIVLIRTFYVSQCGNFFAEVGIQSGIGDYVCLGTFLNNNVFLETHSKLTKSMEVIPEMRLPGDGPVAVRKSGKDCSIYELLAMHDQLIQEHLRVGAEMEGCITEQNVVAAVQFASRVVAGTTAKPGG